MLRVGNVKEMMGIKTNVIVDGEFLTEGKLPLIILFCKYLTFME